MALVTVLIAPAEAVPALRQQPFLQESLVFTGTETALALVAIREHVPAIIAVERELAASQTGAAFLREIRADAALSGCQIQMVGVRQSPRFRVHQCVTLDGESAMLLDISTTGARVVSPGALRPAQPVTLGLTDGAAPLRAVAVWVQYELPSEGPRYRAGIQFMDSADPGIAAYISQVAR